jgi:hypothetical protein
MSVFDGNGYFFDSYLTTSTVSNVIMTQSTIKTSSIDMLNTAGNYQNIINVKDPIDLQDAATKNYVDTLGITFQCALSNTSSSIISSRMNGSFIITVSNNVLNGPCAIFHVVKSNSTQNAGIARTVAAPGLSGNTQLNITWAPSSGIYLNKTNGLYDGSYNIKMI